MKILKNIAYGTAPEQVLDLYLPEESTLPTFVYFHGGGLEKRQGDKSKGYVMAEYLASHGAAVVLAEYRRYPEASYPDYLKDCAAAVSWAEKNLETYGASAKLCVGGSSAGGYTSMMLCFDKRWLLPYFIKPETIAAYYHDAGQPTTHFNLLRERGIDSRRVIVDDSAPLYHIGELPSYPPMHFVISDQDIQNRYEQTMLVMSTMKHLGYDMSRVSWELVHGKHCAYVSKKDENGESVFGRMIETYLKTL